MFSIPLVALPPAAHAGFSHFVFDRECIFYVNVQTAQVRAVLPVALCLIAASSLRWRGRKSTKVATLKLCNVGWESLINLVRENLACSCAGVDAGGGQLFKPRLTRNRVVACWPGATPRSKTLLKRRGLSCSNFSEFSVKFRNSTTQYQSCERRGILRAMCALRC